LNAARLAADIGSYGTRNRENGRPARLGELIGAETDSERAIRWLIAPMVLCCDPLAIALTAAASARLANPLH
jgi:hypothetical protein